MTSPEITDAAVNAVFRDLVNQGYEVTMHGVREALTAALPHLAAGRAEARELLVECSRQLGVILDGDRTDFHMWKADIDAFLKRNPALAAGRAEAVAAPAAEADWKKAFAAQSRKLQAVLHIPGVKETLAELTWYDGHDPSASQEALRDALASHIATVIDDIEVTKDGFCKWSDVANARDAIYRTVRSAALAQSAPVKAGE